MSDEAIHVWDGVRPLLKRDIVTRRQVEISRLGIVSAIEKLAEATDWCFEEDHHTIVVHLEGRLDRMDCEFARGPSGSALPLPGDVWMIPARCRYAALAQGESARFVEFRVPAAVLADAPLGARVQYRDPFIHGAAARLAELMDKPGDDLAAMAAHGIVEALKLHLLEAYGRHARPCSGKALSAANRAALVAFIHDQLDANHSLSSLAALAGMEVRLFTSAFKHAFGLTPWQYVLRARLEEAARLLERTSDPVTEIALQVGFTTPSHFATAFAHRFGVSPSRYRARVHATRV